TGSGLLALLAARSGARALALDINPEAVGCASRNARRNGLAERMEVVESDVFDAVEPARRFNLVVTNPPFYPRTAQEPSDHAFASGLDHAFFTKLAAGLSARLKPKGRLIMIHSSDTDFAPIARQFEARGLSWRVSAKHRGLFETLTIREFRRAG
ncbi:MAG: methyltransferase, partial [Vicinamibacteria bacterium]|nr:methyltransferase [Vicinamibacteria bacterium]